MSDDPLAGRAISEIERVGPLSPEEFGARYRRARRPVVLRVGQCGGEWSLDRLSRIPWARPVAAIRTEGGRLKGSAAAGTRFERVQLDEVVAELAYGAIPDWHVSTPIDDFPPEIGASAPVPTQCAGAAFLRSRVWLAPAGTVTPLHWDMPLNIIRPLFGRRRVLLYPASHGLYLSPNAPLSQMPNFAAFDPERPDLGRFPWAHRARAVRTVLAPGELLFIPSGWWHHIRSLETSMVVNYWFGGRALALAWQAAQLYKSARGLYTGEWSFRSVG